MTITSVISLKDLPKRKRRQFLHLAYLLLNKLTQSQKCIFKKKQWLIWLWNKEKQKKEEKKITKKSFQEITIQLVMAFARGCLSHNSYQDEGEVLCTQFVCRWLGTTEDHTMFYWQWNWKTKGLWRRPCSGNFNPFYMEFLILVVVEALKPHSFRPALWVIVFSIRSRL